MNLHGIASPYIGVVNPLIPVLLRASVGYAIDENFVQRPSYATPGAVTAQIIGGRPSILEVTAVASGFLAPGQTVSGVGVLIGTQIVEQVDGVDGGAGTYLLDRTYPAAVGLRAMTTNHVIMAQVQPMSWGDLQQLDGLNLNGTKRKIYLNGVTESVVRSLRKGGDLIEIVGGVNAGVWLCVQIIEQFPDWVSAAIVLQNEP